MQNRLIDSYLAELNTYEKLKDKGSGGSLKCGGNFVY
jgi:hypothetical protein